MDDEDRADPSITGNLHTRKSRAPQVKFWVLRPAGGPRVSDHVLRIEGSRNFGNLEDDEYRSRTEIGSGEAKGYEHARREGYIVLQVIIRSPERHWSSTFLGTLHAGTFWLRVDPAEPHAMVCPSNITLLVNHRSAALAVYLDLLFFPSDHVTARIRGPPATRYGHENIVYSEYSLARTCRPNGVQESCVTTGAGQFGLVDPNSTPELIAAIVEANRAIIARIEHTFYYSNPMDLTIPDTMYRHGVLQAVFNLACFGKKSNRRGHYFTDMDTIPVEMLTLVVTTIACVLDEWKTGRQVDHQFEADPYAAYYDRTLAHLRGWITYNADKAIDVAKPL
ncbi:hypothetical protein B0H13DRAFT_1898052 [Mycena leptocephala]|nr:hypothetical protein B0H13DRAFT_1898052 [Mycena leptocephala]